MVACNSHQTTPRSRARDRLSQYFIGLCLKFEILSREPPCRLRVTHIKQHLAHARVINYRNKSQYFIGLCLNLRFYRAR